ncbi:hypothetical protein O9993_05360 [Vibrio lentus]|nr:hypothetical protein [Vibrio lentus]
MLDLSQFRVYGSSQSGTPTLSAWKAMHTQRKEYTLTTRQVTAPTHEQSLEKQALHIL